MIDIVYPLGSGSAWNNHELRYSLRSVEKHLQRVRNVIIVGECPSWLRKVIHIPFREPDKIKERNILRKLLEVCHLDFVSMQFLMLNDDHILLQPADAPTFPYYYNRDLMSEFLSRPADPYCEVLNDTRTALLERGLSQLHFDIHCPVRYGKTSLPTTEHSFASLNEDYSRWGLAVKSMYCNSQRSWSDWKGETQIDDCIIHKPMEKPALRKKLEGQKFFSFTDAGLNDNLKKYLRELFPHKSKYEG